MLQVGNSLPRQDTIIRAVKKAQKEQDLLNLDRDLQYVSRQTSTRQTQTTNGQGNQYGNKKVLTGTMVG